jgi:hypothetical protein
MDGQKLVARRLGTTLSRKHPEGIASSIDSLPHQTADAS